MHACHNQLRLPAKHRLREAVGTGMPAMRHISPTNPWYWLGGIDDISSYLEQRHPVPPLGTLAASDPAAV